MNSGFKPKEKWSDSNSLESSSSVSEAENSQPNSPKSIQRQTETLLKGKIGTDFTEFGEIPEEEKEIQIEEANIDIEVNSPISSFSSYREPTHMSGT